MGMALTRCHTHVAVKNHVGTSSRGHGGDWTWRRDAAWQSRGRDTHWGLASCGLGSRGQGSQWPRPSHGSGSHEDKAADGHSSHVGVAVM